MTEEFYRMMRRVSGSLAVPVSMVHDEVATSFAASHGQMKLLDAGLLRNRRTVGIYFDNMLAGVMGRPPRSAVDRLADLLEEDDGA